MTARTILPAIAIGTVLAVTAAGCGTTSNSPDSVVSLTRLRVSGSGTCLPLLRILAAGWPDKGVKLVFLPGLHSAGGIKGVTQGTLDIGALSRELTESERSPGYTVTWLSKDGLVIAVNQSVGRLGIDNITEQQVRDIYSGKLTDWKQLGASKSLPIVVLDRHEDESAKIIMRQYVFGPAASFHVTPNSVNLYYESDMVDALQTTSGAVGYFSLGYAISQDIPVTRLKLNGVEATVETVRSGAYRIVRPLGIMTRADAPAAVKAFAQWATGPQAREMMIRTGYAPYRD